MGALEIWSENIKFICNCTTQYEKNRLKVYMLYIILLLPFIIFSIHFFSKFWPRNFFHIQFILCWFLSFCLFSLKLQPPINVSTHSYHSAPYYQSLTCLFYSTSIRIVNNQVSALYCRVSNNPWVTNYKQSTKLWKKEWKRKQTGNYLWWLFKTPDKNKLFALYFLMTFRFFFRYMTVLLFYQENPLL